MIVSFIVFISDITERILRCPPLTALPAARFCARIPGTAARERAKFSDDLQVEPEAQAFRILDVKADHLIEGRAVLAAHLPKPGQARHRIKAPPLPRLVELVFVRDAGPRPHEAHLAAHDIDKLRQFIQPRGAQQGAQRNQARIASRVQLGHGHLAVNQLPQVVPMRTGLRIHMHRPELVASKLAPLVAHAPLAEEHRPRRAADHQQRHAGAEDQQTRAQHQDEATIEHTFPYGKPGGLFTLHAAKATVLPLHIHLLQFHAQILRPFIHALIIRPARKTAIRLNTETDSVELRMPPLLPREQINASALANRHGNVRLTKT